MTRAPAKRRTPRKAKADTTGIDVWDSPLTEAPKELAERIRSEGGAVIGAYRDPLGGHPLVVAVLPTGKIEPTPFQRDLSDTHHKRLAEVIQKTGRFLDPLIAI